MQDGEMYTVVLKGANVHYYILDAWADDNIVPETVQVELVGMDELGMVCRIGGSFGLVIRVPNDQIKTYLWHTDYIPHDAVVELDSSE